MEHTKSHCYSLSCYSLSELVWLQDLQNFNDWLCAVRCFGQRPIFLNKFVDFSSIIHVVSYQTYYVKVTYW